MLPSNYSAASVSDLIGDIKAANAAGGANTITLTAATTAPYVLTTVNNTTNGSTGLPVIAAKDNLTILGSGDTIERRGGTSSTPFRLLEVASGASLTLQNLTLQNGLASQWTAGWQGGAIYNQGTLVLDGVTVQGNMAGPGGGLEFGNAFGGGIFSSGGSVTLEGDTIVHNNEAISGSEGGNAYGGGVCAMGGTVTVTNATLDNNTAEAGRGSGASSPEGSAYGGGLYANGASVTLTNATLDGNGAAANNVPDAFFSYGAFGGGLYLSGGTTTLANCTVQENSALNGNPYGHGEGGGIYIYSGTVHVDGATLAQVTGNTASDGAAFDNIVGPYILTL